jgi:hypothetical protein
LWGYRLSQIRTAWRTMYTVSIIPVIQIPKFWFFKVGVWAGGLFVMLSGRKEGCKVAVANTEPRLTSGSDSSYLVCLRIH